MAIWQFHAFLIPRVVFEARFGFQKAEFRRSDVLDDVDNWPNREQAKSVLRDLSEILPEMPDYWAIETGKAWGNYESNIIEVGFEKGDLQEVEFRVDLRTPNFGFIQTVIGLAKRNNLLLFTEENTALLPDETTFVHALKSSRASRFLNDPKEFLRQLKEIQ